MPQYKIKSGDTLSQIAKSKGFSLNQLKAANPNITDLNKINKLQQDFNFDLIKSE